MLEDYRILEGEGYIMEQANSMDGNKGALIYRHKRITRLTHWIWAISLLLLLMSGLQIFNAHPTLYWGQCASENARCL
jgi:Ni,Fe-hydrogenase I cytochrome b subunit